jgi:hypothetical protein
MKNAPNSRTNLDKAIQRFAGEGDFFRANELRGLMANAIVAQMIGDGVVKGGSGLRFRYGAERTRATMDLDTAWKTGLDEFLKDLRSRLEAGWNGFSGEVRILRPSAPRGVPFEYVMQPCAVKLRYRAAPWYTVELEIGHNEIGDADAQDMIELPATISELFEFLALPKPGPIPAMRLEYQIAQKLHGASAPSSKRAHDLIDLQLIAANADLDLRRVREVCLRLFQYRRGQSWPPTISANDGWRAIYDDQKRDLPVLPTVEEAVAWANDLAARINEAL